MDGIFILSLRRSARFSKTKRDERRFGGGRETATRPPAMRLRVVSIRAVSRSERGSEAGCLYVGRCYTFIYLSERGKTHGLAQPRLSVEKKCLFVHY